MTHTPQIARMKELIPELQEASKTYYQDNIEIISNLEYDRLYEELESLEALTGVQLTDSPTLQVGFEAVEGLNKVTHEIPLLSLDKTKDVDALSAFLEGHIGLLSWKLDGLTVVLDYQNGKLARAVTRGNGTIGEDVTHNARKFKNIPLHIPYTDRLLIRGEAIITYKDFEKINNTITNPDEKYKNPRNLCSGTVRQLDNSIVSDRYVQFYAFAILTEGGPVTKCNRLSLLANLGFDTVEHLLTGSNSIADDVEAFKQKLPQMDIPSDGLVLTFDDVEYSKSLGATSKFPKDSIAFKWQDELVETTLRYIEWNTSRTGLINPIAVFDPVEIEGTTVNKAGLHNVSIIRQLKLGEGDTITVYKANMIIPQVAENLTCSDTIVLPANCPVCKSPSEIFKQKEGEALFCPNPVCHARQLGALVHFCSRDAMNIEGLSEQTLEKWINHGFIKDYTDIFTLERFKDEIIKMEGFGEKSFSNLMDSIERAKDVNLANFIFALGIKNVGLNNAKLLCANFNDMEAIMAGTDFEEIKGFGKIIGDSLRAYFADTNNVERIRKATNILRVKLPEPNENNEDNKALKGLTFVITGSVEKFLNRKALQEFIEGHGGKCTGSVSASTSYLINNDATSASAKNKKAKSLGIPILTEEDFILTLLEDPYPQEP